MRSIHRLLRRLLHRHRPVYRRWADGFGNAWCQTCGFFPLPIEGARYLGDARDPSTWAAR